jgi:phospholipase C
MASNPERETLTRRDLLKLAAVTAAGCATGVGSGPPPVEDGEIDVGDLPPLPEGSGARVAAPAIPAAIDTFVILCMENRSFDHYLGTLRLLEGRALDGLTGSETNPAPEGSVVPVHLLDDFTPADPPHGWDASHAQWNNGRNDGFVRAHAGSNQDQVMGYHVRQQLDVTYTLADTSTVCDRWNASVMGPTWPNRLYLHGATALGQKSNRPVFGFKSVFKLLESRGLRGTNFYHDVAWATAGYFKLTGYEGIEKFLSRAAAGTLPALSIIDPQYFGAGANDDHPDHDVRLGQALIGTVVRAMGRSPQWSRSLLVVTYDEHGGFFDHAPPGTMTDERADFRRLGFRVPTLVAGPYVRRGGVCSAQLDHVSVIATLTRRFGLGVLNARVAATQDLSAALDPNTFNAPRPPPELPVVDIDAGALAWGITARDDPAHAEMRALFDSGRVPAQLDRRGDGLAIARHVLEAGAHLGAVKLR